MFCKYAINFLVESKREVSLERIYPRLPHYNEDNGHGYPLHFQAVLHLARLNRSCVAAEVGIPPALDEADVNQYLVDVLKKIKVIKKEEPSKNGKPQNNIGVQRLKLGIH